MIRWFAMSVGSILWGVIVFSAGLSMAFPGDFLKDHLSLMVQESTQKKMLLHIGDARYSGVGGIKLSQVALFESKPGRRTAGETGTPARSNTLMTSVDELYLRPQILPLLSGMLQADIGLKLTGGRLNASFGASPSMLRIASDTEDFDLSHHPLQLDGDSVGLQGLLNIDGDIVLNLDEIKESEGELSIDIDDFGLTGGTISGFTLMETTFSEAELKFDVEDGKAMVSKGSFIGDMLEATVDGHITLRKDPLKSRLSLKIQVRFDETLDKLAKIALKDSRDKDGVYHFKGRGTVTNPRWSQDRQTRRSGSKRSKAQRNNDSSSRSAKSSKANMSDAEREERREKRKERLKERRERMKKRREERRARQREREEQNEYDAIDEQNYDDRNIPPDPDMEEPVYEEEVEPEYNDNEFNDENDPNANMEDLGYIDE